MTTRRREPKWLTRRMRDALHDAQLREHGGSPGFRDEGLLESALVRPRQKWAYAGTPDLSALAASYTFALAKNHGYIDGNKRVAFMAAYVFLGLNGHEFDASEPDVASTIERVASGSFGEADLAEWYRAGLRAPD